MTQASHPARAMGAAETVPSERVIRLLRWSLALFFVGAGAAKLIGVPAAVSLFAKVGLGQWFRYAVGLYELVGAALLAYPRTTVAGTIALSALMLGAGATEMLILERLPLSSGATLAALVLLAVLVRAADRGAGRFP
jgi:putative oxidoreductase